MRDEQIAKVKKYNTIAERRKAQWDRYYKKNGANLNARRKAKRLK